jgi:ornithine cyclodeaminase/alanine dehydrogenase-like protein (mu-crystallin family)
MLLLKEIPVKTILTIGEMIQAVEDSLLELAKGTGYDLPRRRIHHPNRMIFGVLPGSFREFMGAYLQVDRDRSIWRETIILYHVETGEPLVMFQDCGINEYRTGAAGALGVKYLAKQSASSVGVLGTGPQAKAQLLAINEVRELKEVKAFSPNPEHRRAFARGMAAAIGRDVRAVDTPQEAVEGIDIVVVATNSQKPVFEGAGLAPGAHIDSIANGDKNRRREELDLKAFERSDLLYVTSKETVAINESDIFRMARDGVISWDSVHEFGDLLLGRSPGRTSKEQITLYKLQGIGIMDIAIGALAYERAKELGLGRQW